jgi:BlaI family transcriptional regulator, penicillinase repressor
VSETPDRLSRAEAEILRRFWDIGPASVREIVDALKTPTAYTTVQTLVYRLEAKGAVTRVKKIGNAHVFAAAIAPEAFRGGIVKQLLSLFAGSPKLLVSSLVEQGDLSLEDLEAIRRTASAVERKSGRKRQ